MDVGAGVPVADAEAAAAAVGGDVRADELPAGRYAVLLHVGPFDGLTDATARLLAWGGDQDLAWDITPTPAGDRWGGRVETYLTDPRAESDPAKYETELAIRLAD